MNARNLILVAAAVLVAVGTAFLVRGWLSAERTQIAAQPAPPAATRSVLVANADLPAGLFLKDGHLRWQPWPEEALDPGYLIEGEHDMTDFFGAVVRDGIAAGLPITQGRVVRPGDRGFLAAVLQPGMRAVSVAVTPTSGISGLVFPGDRVDVILTHTLPAEETEATYQQRASETILENVRILAIDQSLNDQEGQAQLAKTATVEVTPHQAEMIAVVGQLGQMSLSLRSLTRSELAAADPAGAESGADSAGLSDNTAPERGTTYTLDNQVSRLLKKPAGKTGQVILVLRGNTVEEVTLD